MKHVFGPVPSRRLGQSLGIDPVPLKTCNWNCVYCQLGRSVPMVNERRDYFPREKTIAEVARALEAHKPGEIDWITFVGSGETTLNRDIGWLIRQVKALTELPVAVITNGSLLHLPEVREELLAADAVMPSLDAGNARLYKQINRPHPQATFERLVGGIAAFRKEFRGRLWVEVMLVRGLNDSSQALAEIARRLQDIPPDEVHLLGPERPPVETWVEPPDREGMLRAHTIFGGIARVIDSAAGSFDLSGDESLLDAVIGIITRHPMREDQLVATLRHASPDQVVAALATLGNSGRAQVVERLGMRFWSASPARYPPHKS